MKQNTDFGHRFATPILADQPQNFSKGALGANITNFEGKRAPKKTHFLSKLYKECPNTLFFEKVACGAEIFLIK